MNIENHIKKAALDTGFDAVGITSPEPLSDFEADILKNWIKSNQHGKMQYMQRNLHKRLNPRKLTPWANSVICAAISFKQKNEPKKPNPPYAVIADYACCPEYHNFLKIMLKKLAKKIDLITKKQNRFKFCVDSVPLPERSLAKRANLGFIGKNHMLTNTKLGSQILLAEIITDLKLEPEKISENKKHQCGNCRLCIDACPTGAIRNDGSFDSNKCISYLTIELKDDPPKNMKPKIKNSLFGCDRCSLACPYTKNAPPAKNSKFTPSRKLKYIDPHKILKSDQQKFQILFENSPLIRTGLEKIKKNARICLQNSTA